MVIEDFVLRGISSQRLNNEANCLGKELPHNHLLDFDFYMLASIP